MKPIDSKDISWMNRLRMVRAFFSVVRDVERTNDVFVLGERLPDSSMLSAVEFVADGPYAERAFSEQPVWPKIDLARLRTLPEGTLGREYAAFMDKRGLDPEFHPAIEVKNRAKYIRLHLYQTHDLWHVVTGFASDPAGELGLQAFYYAQVDLPLPILLIAAGLLNAMLYQPSDVTNRLDQIAQGWRLGLQAKRLFGFPWQEHWSTPLHDIRDELGLKDRPIVRPLDRPAARVHATAEQYV